MAHPAIMALPCAECGRPGDEHTELAIERCKVKALVRLCAERDRRIQRLESALRPFSNTVCSMRWFWNDTGAANGEADAKDEGLWCSWSELEDAHEALEGKCQAEQCARAEAVS